MGALSTALGALWRLVTLFLLPVSGASVERIPYNLSNLLSVLGPCMCVAQGAAPTSLFDHLEDSSRQERPQKSQRRKRLGKTH